MAGPRTKIRGPFFGRVGRRVASLCGIAEKFGSASTGHPGREASMRVLAWSAAALTILALAMPARAIVVADLPYRIGTDARVATDVFVNGKGPFSFLLRSEEHTSELQSPSVISYAVFCLKKKK